MACRCVNSVGDREQLLSALAQVNLQEVGEQAMSVAEMTASEVQHLAKAERADALGYGPDVVRLHRAAAERDNAQAKRQIQATIARLEERVRRDDWADLSMRVKQAFDQHDGLALVEEARAHIRDAVYEM